MHLSEDNSLILSESLEENAVNILVDVAISTIFPKRCKEWRVAMMDSRRSFREEMTKRQDKVWQELKSQELALRHALRDAVANDVTKLFPCVSICGSPSTVC